MSEIPANSRASMALASILLTHSPLFMARGERQETMTLAMIGQPSEGPHVLEGAGDAHVDDIPGLQPDDLLALEANAAGIGFQNGRDQPQQRGLAGAVGADQSQHLAPGPWKN